MDALEGLPSGWEVWSAEPGGRVVLAYRPDVFDAAAFPAACLPTITVAPGRSPDRPPARSGDADAWYVALYLEPAVRVRAQEATYPSRAAALEGARATAAAFAAGEVAYRDAYHDPREAYLAELDRLTGDNGER